MSQKERILAELEQIRMADADGLLKAESVVEFARRSDSVLHGQFTWDDGEAAHAWRLAQARSIIRASITILPAVPREIRAYISLSSDRKRKAGGYRSASEVMSTEEHRRRRLSDLFKQLKNIMEQHKDFEELAGLWSALDEAMEKQKSSLVG